MTALRRLRRAFGGEDVETKQLREAAELFENAIRAAKNGAVESDSVRHAIERTTDNRPFVLVENDILDGVPEADVVVGTRKNGEMVLYDVLNLKNTAFKKKETDAAISTNPSPGAARNTASVSNSNMPPSAGNSNTENSGKRSAYEDTEEQMAKL